MPVTLTIVVVTFNSSNHIERCIQSLIDSANQLENDLAVKSSIIVVDNGSSDNTKQLCNEIHEVTFVESEKNGGMAYGNNFGIRRLPADWYFLINADAFVEKSTLVDLLRPWMDTNHSKLGAIVANLRNIDGSSQSSIRSFPNAWNYATEFLGFRNISRTSRTFNRFYGGGLDREKSQWIDWGTGAAIVIPQSTIDQVGLMDESYFMYGEEVDWMKRMSVAGLRIWYEHNAHVKHIGGGSSHSISEKMYLIQIRNHIKYSQNYLGVFHVFLVRLILSLGLGLRAIFSFIKTGENRKSFRIYLRAIRAVWSRAT